MSNRRDFLKGIIPAVVVTTMPTEDAKADEDDCEYHARCLVDAMQAKHGGIWQFSINHDLKAAMVFAKSSCL